MSISNAKAIIVQHWIQPNQLTVSPLPPSQIECTDDQVLVEIKATGINFADILLVQGKYQ
ncbi:hypothetical protein HDU99_008918, partial [Rhizoclosmatium hyalinum]